MYDDHDVAADGVKRRNAATSYFISLIPWNKDARMPVWFSMISHKLQPKGRVKSIFFSNKNQATFLLYYNSIIGYRFDVCGLPA